MAAARGADRSRGGPPCDTPTSNTRGRDRTTAQIAKRRLQRRQVFWRSGVSTTSERRHAPTGHARQTVAQRETTGSVRRSIEAVTEGLEVAAPDPHLVCHERQLTRRRTPKPKRPWTLTELWTRRRAHSSLQNRADAVSHKRPPPSSFVIRTPERKDGESSPDFYVSTWLATVERGQTVEPRRPTPDPALQ